MSPGRAAALYWPGRIRQGQKEIVMAHGQRVLGLGAVLLAAVALFGFTQLALAASPGAHQGHAVTLSDLDLNTREGVETLYHRIESAARTACGPPVITGSRLPTYAWQACVADAIKGAVVKFDRPQLTAYYAERLAHAPDPKLAARDR
jgi:UrcA family protein